MITLPWRESFRYVACVSLSVVEVKRVIDALVEGEVRQWLERAREDALARAKELNDNEDALYALCHQQEGEEEEA
jgi:hypothetical protein